MLGPLDRSRYCVHGLTVPHKEVLDKHQLMLYSLPIARENDMAEIHDLRSNEAAEDRELAQYEANQARADKDAAEVIADPAKLYAFLKDNGMLESLEDEVYAKMMENLE